MAPPRSRHVSILRIQQNLLRLRALEERLDALTDLALSLRADIRLVHDSLKNLLDRAGGHPTTETTTRFSDEDTVSHSQSSGYSTTQGIVQLSHEKRR